MQTKLVTKYFSSNIEKQHCQQIYILREHYSNIQIIFIEKYFFKNFTELSQTCSQKTIFSIKCYLNIQTMFSEKFNFIWIFCAYLNNIYKEISIYTCYLNTRAVMYVKQSIVSVCLPNCQPPCIMVSLSVCMAVYQIACFPVGLHSCQPACLSAFLPACLPSILPACLPAYLPACMHAPSTPPYNLHKNAHFFNCERSHSVRQGLFQGFFPTAQSSFETRWNQILKN